MKQTVSLISAVAFGFFSLACASSGAIPEEGRLERPPTASNGFTPNTQVEIFVARAQYFDDTEKLFGENLIEEFGVIPIAVRLGVKGEGAQHQTIYADPAQMDFRLFLQDGTAVERVSVEQIAKDDEELEKKLNSLALHENDLPSFDAATPRYVFFRLAPRKQFELDGNRLLHRAGKVERALSIERSLLAFRVSREGLTLPYYIGLTRGQRSSN